MNKQIFISTIIILLFVQVFTPIPVWDFNSIAIDLFSSTETTHDYILYNKKENGISVELKKTITKKENQIMSQNYITIDSITQEVDFEDIDSQYTNKLGYDILICPKGKFHPYDFKNHKYIEPSGFEVKGGWDLRCFAHDNGFFFIFYLINNGKNIYFTYKGDLLEQNTFSSRILDFILENGDNGDIYEYKFITVIFFNNTIGYQENFMTFNFVENKINLYYKLTLKEIISSKKYARANFGNDNNLYYFTYNNITDFISGYIENNIDFY